MQRTAAAIERLGETLLGRDIVAVAHGGSIRAAVALALGLSPPQAMAIVIDNLSLAVGAVPEPATWAMMIAGFGLAGVAVRRRSRIAFA